MTSKKTSLFPLFRCTNPYCAILTDTPLYLYTLHSYVKRGYSVVSSTMATKPTWAEVAHKKKPPAFLPMECTVNLEQFAAPQRLPPSSTRYSVFIPLPSVYKQSWALDIVTQLPSSVVGMVPHADISLLEVCFANKEVQ